MPLRPTTPMTTATTAVPPTAASTFTLTPRSPHQARVRGGSIGPWASVAGNDMWELQEDSRTGARPARCRHTAEWLATGMRLGATSGAEWTRETCVTQV